MLLAHPITAKPYVVVAMPVVTQSLCQSTLFSTSARDCRDMLLNSILPLVPGLQRSRHRQSLALRMLSDDNEGGILWKNSLHSAFIWMT
mmetsp:Transcript_77124/g.121794  ORF Transcript_77124/g.121794 Transcript_77124/m.121794 type:complete len:89 (-) Transcript_77124:185-451(-)